MTWLRWFARKTPAQAPAPFENSVRGLTQAAPRVPVPSAPASLSSPVAERAVPSSRRDGASPRKIERQERRELLYAVVREAMNRAGVLSASYRFKVLSLEPRGRQYLIMMDLAHRSVTEIGRLSDVEASIAQAAQKQHNILVTAVYWRYREDEAAVTLRPQAAVVSRPPQSPQCALAAAAGDTARVPDFQDTEVAQRETRSSLLSVTQYGDLA